MARNDQNRDNGELVDRLHAVNTRAIDLTEALLLLSRADRRSFTREHVDLSLIAEEATETLLPIAEDRGVTIETSGDVALTIGSHALLLQLTTNLLHNAIVHNLPEQGSVWVTTSVHANSLVLTVENTGEKLTPQLVSTLVEPFQRGTNRTRTERAGVGLGLAIVNSITQAHGGTLTLTPRTAGGLRVTVQIPDRNARALMAEDKPSANAPPDSEHVGLIGGLGVGAAVIYYRAIAAGCAECGTVPRITIVHANAPPRWLTSLPDGSTSSPTTSPASSRSFAAWARTSLPSPRSPTRRARRSQETRLDAHH